MEETDLSTDEQILEPEILIVVLNNQLNLISEVEQLYASDLGEPDCKLTNPCLVEKTITGEYKITKWLSDFTDDKISMISSDKILTLVNPKKSLINEYLKIIK
jgi:hypothetical protein